MESKKIDKEKLRSECIKFGKFIANSYNTEPLDVDDVEDMVPEWYDDYLYFCGMEAEKVCPHCGGDYNKSCNEVTNCLTIPRKK